MANDNESSLNFEHFSARTPGFRADSGSKSGPKDTELEHELKPFLSGPYPICPKCEEGHMVLKYS